MSGGIWEMNAWSLIKAGGPIMAPILLCSFISLAIIFEKIIYLSLLRTDISKLKETIFGCLKNNDIKKALAVCDENKSPVAKILRAGVVKFSASRDEIKENMEDVSLFVIPKLEGRLGALATIAHITPLLGLLGTVTGMTASFHTIQVRASSLNPVTPGDLAGGIGEALLTTVAGLMVAIPTYVAYNYFVSRINRFVIDMERAATEFINFASNLSASPQV